MRLNELKLKKYRVTTVHGVSMVMKGHSPQELKIELENDGMEIDNVVWV